MIKIILRNMYKIIFIEEEMYKNFLFDNFFELHKVKK